MSVGVAIVASLSAVVLLKLIAFVTNFAFFHRWSLEDAVPAQNALGVWVIFVPVVGGLIVGFMARYGSKAIRGHGIPEAMEQVLVNDSRIPARLTFLKPVSAAISIGTGGPFGAEGPIIATGGALGSLVGQITSTTPAERKTLLAAGAAAGMAATFGSPVSAVLLAVELLLFEFRPRSIIPGGVGQRDGDRAAAAIVGSRADLCDGRSRRRPLSALAFYAFLGAGSRTRRRRSHARGLCDRGAVRAVADPLDVVACGGSGGGRRRRLFRPATPWASATTTSRSILSNSIADEDLSCSCAVMKLIVVVDLALAAGLREARWLRC